MAILTLNDIKEADDVKTQEIFVPEWNGNIVMKGVTQAELQKITKSSTIYDKNGESKIDELNFMLIRLCFSIVEPSISIDNISWLKNKSASTLKRLTMYSDILSAGMEVIDPLATNPIPDTENIKENKVENEK